MAGIYTAMRTKVLYMYHYSGNKLFLIGVKIMGTQVLVEYLVVLMWQTNGSPSRPKEMH